MRHLLFIALLTFSTGLYAQEIFIDWVKNDCPDSDILSVCLGQDNSYVGQYNFITYNHSCTSQTISPDDTITGTQRIYRNVFGEYFLEDFSFGYWPNCYNIEPPTGTLRLNVECNTIYGLTGTDNFGDVWDSGNIRYTGNSIVLDWFNSYGEFGTTELTPIDGTNILDPEVLINDDYTILWSTGETSRSIETNTHGRYEVTVTGPNGFTADAFVYVPQDNTILDGRCSNEILEISYFLDDNINGIQDPEETDVAAGEDYVQLIVAPLMSSIENGTTERHALTTFPYIIQDIHPHLDISNLPTQIQLAENSGITELSLGLFAVNDAEEISVSISTTHIERCNTVVPFQVKVKNTGTAPYEGPLVIEYNPVIEFVNATPEPQEIKKGNISYDISLEEHGDELTFILLLKMPPVDFLGEVFCLTPNTGDLTKSLDEYCFEISCAYDPNDKHGTPFRGDKNPTLFEEEVKYTIRFENLGKDTAFDIRIEDQLSESFDINSYRFLQSSHTVTRQYINDERTLIFMFDNIQLPSIEQDSVENKGFVQFAISPIEGLEVDHELSNTAEIYFDFNDPIITNTTTHTLVKDLTTSINTLNEETVLFNLYPNPATDNVQISTDQTSSAYKYELLDTRGSLISVGRFVGSHTLDVSNIDAGVYILRLTDQKTESHSQKLVIH